jgi:hypothetical protein
LSREAAEVSELFPIPSELGLDGAGTETAEGPKEGGIEGAIAILVGDAPISKELKEGSPLEKFTIESCRLNWLT